MILDDILAYKYREVKEKKTRVSLSKLEKGIDANTKGFYEVLKKDKSIKLIAELKKASPSKGIIREDFEPAGLAKECAAAGASALSVLTDEKFFKGSLDYLKVVTDAVGVPVLRKDFIIDEYQIVEARAYGADAVLLLGNVLDEKKLGRFLELSHSYKMDALVEVHTKEELEKVLDAGPKTIGINNRNLKTFEVDIRTTERLILDIPEDKLVVSESGIKTRQDVLYLESLGVGACLVGTAIMASPSPEEKVKELLGRG